MGSEKVIAEVSSGGFVVSKTNPLEVALIARFNRGGKLEWCIPKGHLENDETIEQAAIREVFEETGLEASISEYLGEVKYQFTQGSSKVSKTVHVFLMEQVGGELSLEHDPHKEASQLEWVPVSSLLARLSHSNEKKIAELAISRIEAGN